MKKIEMRLNFLITSGHSKKINKYVYTDIIAILLVYYILSFVQLQAIILDCTILITCVY